ncbi:hypothetical protein ACFQI7_35095 [Paenibacillus allorhizosphaerae]|uniref:Uncharacterized protein n=1 Tax=Paenibacillus allorhizosphaerae TaxID=2849866 RepID=A0ABN7TVS1_9BACL|nr:hypothetical protein [Paenibacillus allorhizosphaerae]CAG7657548.1 hypothetical protein PAECIP111802_06769 [Paenibacillus allorhizosphaerae]
MNSFTVHGTLQDRSISVSWTEDGGLLGDVEAIEAVKRIASLYAGQTIEVTPTGPFITGDHLAHSHGALYLINEAFDEIVEITGDNPADDWEPGRIYR